MIKDEPNHTNHVKELQSSHCLVMHENVHLSYKGYKVKNFVSKAIQGTQVPLYINLHCFYIFQNVPPFILKKKKLKKKHKNKQTQHQKLEEQMHEGGKEENHSEEITPMFWHKNSKRLPSKGFVKRSTF